MGAGLSAEDFYAMQQNAIALVKRVIGKNG